MKNLTFKVETITPKIAEKYYALSDNIRHTSEARAQKLARPMIEGRWHVNGQTIKFNCDGSMIDGAHRMRACIIAGKPFTTLVVRGVKDIEEIDTGLVRSAPQLLAKRGYSRCIPLAAAARALWYYLGPGFQHYGGKIGPSHLEVLEIVQKHPKLEDSVAQCDQRQYMVSPSTLGFVHYAGSRKYREQANDFAEKVQLGENIRRGDPAYALRERMMKARATHGAYPKVRSVVGWTIYAWNAAASGDRCNTIRWNDGDDFPEMMGMPRE